MTLLPALRTGLPASTVSEAALPRRGSDYACLLHAVRDAGLLERRVGSYAVRAGCTLAVYAAVCVAVVVVGDSWYQLAVAAVLGLAFGQVAFLGHDAGHQAVFAGRRRNDMAGLILGNALIGLSYGWWVDKHNRHHAHPNDELRDPDMQDGILAFTPAHAGAGRGPVRSFIARRQAWLFFPLLTLEGIGLHVDGIRALRAGGRRSSRGGPRRVEAAALALHGVAFLVLPLMAMSPVKAILFTLIHRAVWGIYMGASFAPNHKGMPVIGPDEEADYLRRQVVTSRNVRGSFLTDLALGGLNYQIEHHLFPSMPRASLRHAQPLVRAHCQSVGVPYCETSLLGSYRAALTHLDHLGAPLRLKRTASRRPGRQPG